MTINSLSEFQLIEEIKKWLDQKNLAVKIGDDAAAFSLKSNLLTLLATDSLIENVHFKLGAITPLDLGYKSLVVNISDIAAMGGTPKFATVSLGLPAKIDFAFIKAFYKGISEAASAYSLIIAGGDLTSSKELVINISVIGQVEKDRILKRSTAKVGEQILVTGSLGASIAAGYTLRPQARVEQAKIAAKIGVKTAIDISDGLISDCQRICEASDVGCRIFADKIPIAKHADSLQMALSGGEDYELIFCTSKNKAQKLKDVFQRKKWLISEVGEIIPKGIEVVDKGGRQIKWQKGYEHFGK